MTESYEIVIRCLLGVLDTVVSDAERAGRDASALRSFLVAARRRVREIEGKAVVGRFAREGVLS